MSMNPQPIKNLDALAQNPEMWQVRRESMTTTSTGFNPLIYGNDIDSVDVATRVAMVRFFLYPYIVFTIYCLDKAFIRLFVSFF